MIPYSYFVHPLIKKLKTKLSGAAEQKQTRNKRQASDSVIDDGLYKTSGQITGLVFYP